MDVQGPPNGAKGIEGEDFAIEFSGGKVIFIAKAGSANRHYTLHPGGNSGIIDVHETTVDDSGEKKHRTLFAVRTNGLPEAMEGLKEMVPEFLGLLRPLRLGWLKHRGIWHSSGCRAGKQ